MPDGATHHLYWKKDLPFVIAAGILLLVVGLFKSLYLSEFAVWMVIWYWMGRYIDPDLDLIGVTQAEGRMLRELSLLGVFLFSFTSFYAAFIMWVFRTFKVKGNTHRSWVTHSIVPGTVLRAGLIDIPLWAIVSTFGDWMFLTFGLVQNFASGDILAFILAQVAGLGISDLRHILLDRYSGDED